MDIFIKYIIIINIVTFILYGIDKWKAVHGKWRIREATLLGAAFVGGSVGGLAGMYIFRHKTKKRYFALGVPIMLLVQIMASVLLYYLIII